MNWNYKLIYKTEADFKKDMDNVLAETNELATFKGGLNIKSNLKLFLTKSSLMEQKLEKLIIYTSLQYAKNSKDILNQQRDSEIMTLFAKINSALAFVEPELISIGQDKIENYLNDDKELTTYKYYFAKLFKNSSHVLDDKSESIIANYSQAINGFNNLHDILAVSDNNDEEVILSDGNHIIVNASNYRTYLEDLEKQEDRQKVFESVFKGSGDRFAH